MDGFVNILLLVILAVILIRVVILIVKGDSQSSVSPLERQHSTLRRKADRYANELEYVAVDETETPKRWRFEEQDLTVEDTIQRQQQHNALGIESDVVIMSNGIAQFAGSNGTTIRLATIGDCLQMTVMSKTGTPKAPIELDAESLLEALAGLGYIFEE
jgi:hypothetical protein